nr:YIP1 family protein [Candidatus Pantoea persica]
MRALSQAAIARPGGTVAESQIASSSAMIVDLSSGKVLFSSHPDRVRPIPYITKLMTVMAALDAKQPLDERISVDISHTPEMRGVFSHVKLNSEISRSNMMMLALISSGTTIPAATRPLSAP